MCGLIAMHTVEKAGFILAEKNELQQMLLINSLRGSHSTGIAGVNMRANSDDVSLIKAVGSPEQLYNWKQSDEFFTRMVQKFTTIIGHGRYATKGDVTAPNAHPFKEGHITLAHNGVINNFIALKDYESKAHNHIEVDSHLIAKLFEEGEAIDVLPKVEGAYVFIWYDSRSETLNIARNHARPLFVGTCKNRDTLIFSSEVETIQWNETRNKTPMKYIEEIKPFNIYTYNKDSLEPIITEYKPFYKVYERPYKNKGSPHAWYEGDYDYDDASTKYANEKWNKPKNKLLPSNLKDTKALSVTKDNKIEAGMTIVFSLDDYKVENGYIQVWGYHKDFPDVVFKASLFDVNEQSIYTMDFVTGVVGSILPNMMTNTDYNWNVFVRNPILLEHEPRPDEEGDERVNIMAIDGSTENMSKFRLKQLGAKGCSWCQNPIHQDAYDKPEELILQVSLGFDDEVVCPTCSSAMLPTLIGEQRVH